VKAIVQDKYGSADLLRLEEIEKPALAAEDEVLVRVRATSVHADVWHVLTGLPYVMRLMGAGVRRPRNRVPGTDVAGIVEAVGGGVTRFRPGDEVFGETLRGHQWANGGAWAEYAVAPESGLAPKPAHIPFEQAAALPTAGLIALLNLRTLGGLEAGQHVLINGAAGGVGSIALQLTKALGATVTAVDRTEKLDLLRSLGADAVIDYAQEDFTRRGERYDLILDIPGNHTLAECKRALQPGGKWVLVGHDNYGNGMRRWVGVLPRMFLLMGRSLFDGQLPRASFATPDKAAEMALLQELLAAGKVTPHIDRAFPLREAADAIRYLQSGDVKGKIVLVV
jgi:NADPH:quinone reductase-like Zn-dependent oxidoreductase